MSSRKSAESKPKPKPKTKAKSKQNDDNMNYDKYIFALPPTPISYAKSTSPSLYFPTNN